VTPSRPSPSELQERQEQQELVAVAVREWTTLTRRAPSSRGGVGRRRGLNMVLLGVVAVVVVATTEARAVVVMLLRPG